MAAIILAAATSAIAIWKCYENHLLRSELIEAETVIARLNSDARKTN